MPEQVHAIDDWFTTDPEPALLGSRCTACGTTFFPAETFFCRNPSCDSQSLETVSLSRRGTVWSYSINHYPAPEPYLAPVPFAPYGVAAVELHEERIIVLGQVARGHEERLAVGGEAELVVEPMVPGADPERLVWKWRPL